MLKILYFGASWCAPCKVFKPVVDQVSQETRIPYQYIDVDSNPELSKNYNVTSIPTIVVTDDSGTVYQRRSGAVSKQVLTQLFQTRK